jgi:hypothetical protein
MMDNPTDIVVIGLFIMSILQYIIAGAYMLTDDGMEKGHTRFQTGLLLTIVAMLLLK